MSSMLEQAIVDAKALREAALKNAEQAVIEKYAPEINPPLNHFLMKRPKQKLRSLLQVLKCLMLLCQVRIPNKKLKCLLSLNLTQKILRLI